MKSLFTLLIATSVMSSLAHAEDTYFDSKGVKIRYVTAGKGEAVVLIHGWMSDATMWGRDSYGNPQLDTKGAEGFQLISMDCRGHGKSDKLYDSKKYGVEMANDVIRLLDHLKIKKAHLVGYSMGAFIAGKVAASHPGRVLSVIYGGQAPLITGAKSTSSGPSETEIFAKAVEEGKGLGSYIMAVMPTNRPKPTQEQADAMAKFMFTGKDVKAFAASGLSLGNLSVKEKDLQRCKAPTLFLYGSLEPQSLKDRAAYFQKLLQGVQIKEIEGADHVTIFTKPSFGAAMEEFIKANKGK